MNEGFNQLIEALALSPDNIPLRLHLAELMVKGSLLDEATIQYQEVLNRNYGNERARKGLANIYYKQKKYSAAIMVYEALMNDNMLMGEEMLPLVRCLIKENSHAEAVEVYKKLLKQKPNFKDEEIDKVLRLSNTGNKLRSKDNDDFDEDDEDDFNGQDEFDDFEGFDFFMEKPNLKFEDVGGMDQVKKEIALKIIQPIKNPDLYKAFGKKSGGGILLYGPPGCGKTYLAKATAGEIDAKFINIGLHDILDMWMGNSEKNLHEMFVQARENAPCVLFIDEVDAIGAKRSDMKGSGVRHIINQFLAEMDGVEHNNEGVLVLAATNAPWAVDSAFRRPGRFDRVIFVAPPELDGRAAILAQHLKDKPTETIDIAAIAAITSGFSGADLKAIVELATDYKLEDSLLKGSIVPITTTDLLKAAKQHKATTAEWFETAKNYAVYANKSGLYDDVLNYLSDNSERE